MDEIRFDAYLENLLGKREKNKLLKALKWGAVIMITGPSGATGKTTLYRVLQERGYNVAEPGLNVHEVSLTEPLEECIPFFERSVL